MKKIIWFLLLVNPLAGRGENIVWTGSGNSVDIGDQVELLDDTSGKLDINQVSDPAMADKFVRSKQKILSLGFSGNVRWMRFSLQNKTSDRLVLVLAQAVLPVADLYFKDTTGQWQCYKAGYNVKLNDKIVQHHFQVYPLSNVSKEYYLRFITFSPPVPVSIWKANAYETKSAYQKFFYGLYAGFLLFVILLNLMLFFIFRKITYLHYSFLVLLYLSISACVMDGYILYIFHGVNLTYTYCFIPPFTMVVSSLYGIRFLEIKRFVPGIYKFSVSVFLYFLIYFLSLLLLPRPLMLLLNQINALLVTFFMFWLGAVAGRHGNRLGYYYAAAYITYFSIVLVEVIYIQTGKPQYLFEVSHVSVATLIESLFLAYLLSMRFNLESREIETEKNRTRERLMQQIRENENITKKQNIILEETVKLRTQEIENQKKIVEETLAEKELLLKKEELLLKEIHHRIKNNLQTISSILMLQSSTLTDENARQAITDSRNRVNAIAIIHQKLYQMDGIEKIEFNSFLKDIVNEVKAVYIEKSRNISINWVIPATYLQIDIAIPLALIITELFTNSFKYGFDGAMEGSIEMMLSDQDDNNLSKAKRVSFKYRDSGPGFYPPLFVETASTLGLRLISLLSAQIGASVKYDNLNGSEFIFTFNISK